MAISTTHQPSSITTNAGELVLAIRRSAHSTFLPANQSNDNFDNRLHPICKIANQLTHSAKTTSEKQAEDHLKISKKEIVMEQLQHGGG